MKRSNLPGVVWFIVIQGVFIICGHAERSLQHDTASAHALRHAIHQTPDGKFRAINTSQRCDMEFGAEGFEVRPQHATWSWGLRLDSLGRTDAHVALGGGAGKAVAEKLSFARGHGVWEWFVNESRGLMHGFTVEVRPPGLSPLEIRLSVRGCLSPAKQPQARSIAFHDKSGKHQLDYGGLIAWDAHGKVLDASLSVSADGDILFTVQDQDAVYPVTIDPVAQQAYIKSFNTGAGDGFGFAMAISGDTAVVGANREDGPTNTLNDAGAAYVFTRANGAWTQQAVLRASNAAAGDLFGFAVAIEGNTIIVGAQAEDGATDTLNDSGAAYVFTRTGVAWTEQTILRAPNAGIDDRFGNSVAIFGDTVIVGAPREDGATNTTSDSGAAYVFTRTGGAWSHQSTLRASNLDAGDLFGHAVAIWGNSVIVGAHSENGVGNALNDSGAAYIFVRNGNTWGEQTLLRASNPGANDLFGIAVAIRGDMAVVGAYAEDGPANNLNAAGAAYVFERAGSAWMERQLLRPALPAEADLFAGAIGLSSTNLVIGAWGKDISGMLDAGVAYNFVRSGGLWVEQGLIRANNAGANDSFGFSLAVAGNTSLVGSVQEDNSAVGTQNAPDAPTSEPGTAADSGAAYAYLVPTGPYPTDLILAGQGDNTLSGGISKKLKGRKTWRFDIYVQNDDAIPKLMLGKITGNALGKRKGAKVIIREGVGRKVTSALERGTYTATLAPAATHRLTASMKATSRTARSWRKMDVRFTGTDGSMDTMRVRARWKR